MSRLPGLENKKKRTDYLLEEAMSQTREILKKTSQEYIGIFDMDENLTNTVAFWVEVINDLLLRYCGISQEKLPTLQQLCDAGGTDKIYPSLIERELGSVDMENYHQFLEFLRSSTPSNIVPKIIEEGISEVVKKLRGEGTNLQFVAYMTARPGWNNVVRASKLQMRGFKMPDLPIIARPKDLPIASTSQWKISHIEKLREGFESKVFFIIDDSAGLAGAIAEHNKQNPDQKIYQIVYPGPLTKPLIESGRLTADHENGIFIATSWAEMDKTIKEMKEYISANSVKEPQEKK